MKIGIIVHSHTGNTLSVAKVIKEKLINLGHEANIEQVTAVNENPSETKNIQLKAIPDIDIYDAVIFGAPVRGFSLSPVMKLYLSQLMSMNGKKVSCYVTQYFPFPWMGGKQSIEQFVNECRLKKANVTTTGIVNWSSKKREKMITDLSDNLSSFINL